MKRIYKIIAGAAAGALIIGLSCFTIILDAENKTLKNQIAVSYQKSFDELVSNMDSLKVKLLKLEAAGGQNQYSALLMDVWRQAADTESCISSLPVCYQSAGTLTQFMNRTGDYCRYLSGKLANGQPLTSDDLKQISSLADTCGEISNCLNESWKNGYIAEADFNGGAFFTDDAKAGSLDFSNQQFPRLIYDGPFSESVENRQPSGLGGTAVSRDEAQKAACAFTGAAGISYVGDLNGKIACYGFAGEESGNPFSIYVSKQGGKVLWYMSQRATGISALPTKDRYAQLADIAKNFLKSKGYGDTAASYAQFYGGMAVINLAPLQDSVVLYPDLLKVWIDISADTVAGLDANNYLMAHRERTLGAPALTEADVKSKLNANMSVTGVRLALIPLDSGEEKLCYEFSGTLNANQYLVYINANTGTEEDILMIRDTNEGKLIM